MSCGFSHIKKQVGGFNPSKKYYSSQNGNLPQTGVENKKYLSCHHPFKNLRKKSLKTSCFFGASFSGNHTPIFLGKVFFFVKRP